MNEQRPVNEQGPKNDQGTENDQGSEHDERPNNDQETIENDQEDVLNRPTSGGTERREAPSENEVSDREHPAKPLRTRGANHGTDIPEEEDDRPTIITIGARFPDTQVTSTISVILKSHFEGPWSTWKNVPQKIKDLMWIEFTVWQSLEIDGLL